MNHYWRLPCHNLHRLNMVDRAKHRIAMVVVEAIPRKDHHHSKSLPDITQPARKVGTIPFFILSSSFSKGSRLPHDPTSKPPTKRSGTVLHGRPSPTATDGPPDPHPTRHETTSCIRSLRTTTTTPPSIHLRQPPRTRHFSLRLPRRRPRPSSILPSTIATPSSTTQPRVLTTLNVRPRRWPWHVSRFPAAVWSGSTAYSSATASAESEFAKSVSGTKFRTSRWRNRRKWPAAGWISGVSGSKTTAAAAAVCSWGWGWSRGKSE